MTKSGEPGRRPIKQLKSPPVAARPFYHSSPIPPTSTHLTPSMQIHSFALFVVVVAVALASAVQPRDLPMGTNLPGKQNKSEWKEYEYPNVYPDPSKRSLRKPISREGHCNFTINFDEVSLPSSCDLALS